MKDSYKNMKNKKTRIILALDVVDLVCARRILTVVGNVVDTVKVGPVLFTACGPKAVAMARSRGAGVFLDLKFHDIPNTVAHAVRQAVRLNVKMLTLHTAGGDEMMRAAAKAAREESRRKKIKKPLLLGITVLTSDKSVKDTKATVVRRARLAKKCGLDGIVCSVHEAKAVRKACGKDFVIVTPGIRPRGFAAGDQKRTATAQDAFAAGADYIVVGRPVVEARDPAAAFKNIL